MTTLYSYTDFYENKGDKLLPLQCEFCKKTFFVTKKRTQQAMREKGRTKCNFCSKSCAAKSKAKIIELECNQCNKKFSKIKSKIKKNKSNKYFCSKKCANIFNY